MFAFLALAGDLGGALGPTIVGTVSQTFGDNLQRGIFAGCIFPVILVISLLLMKIFQANKKE